MLPRRNSNEKVPADIWQVAQVIDQVADLVSLDGEQTANRSVFDLVRVADFTDPIYPGLEVTETLAYGTAVDPWHVLIDAENYHALRAMQFTHPESIDTIYIDSPYNTGNDDWIYADRHVAPEDDFRHSKWLSFMERRLRLAWNLLKPSGVIICAIGDDEHHRLRMLLDQIFGEQHFIANVTWQGGGSYMARHHAGGADYMLIYGKNAEKVGRFLDPKPHAASMIGLVAGALRSGSTVEEAQTQLRTFVRDNAKSMSEGLTRFINIDPNGMIFETADLTNRLPRPNLRYPVTDPATGRVYEPPDNGWTVRKEVMDGLVADGLIAFGNRPRKKKSLVDYMSEMPVPTFVHSRNTANATLLRILGEKRFPFPKDHTVLMRWIGMVTPKDGTVLDFFAGSGSTLEAVLRLNAQDGGRRQCILVTNNEVGSKQEKTLRKAGHRDGDEEWEAAGVCEYVTKPRIRTILTGIRPDGSAYDDTVAGNVQFATLTYEDPALIELDMAFERIAPLLWLTAGASGARVETIPAVGWAVVESYGVLFNMDRHAPFLEALTDQKVAFVVTDDEGQFQRIAAQITPACRAVRLYESYLRSFQLQNEGV
jgi:adenine-specific DNA-methyltransferase